MGGAISVKFSVVFFFPRHSVVESWWSIVEVTLQLLNTLPCQVITKVPMLVLTAAVLYLLQYPQRYSVIEALKAGC